MTTEYLDDLPNTNSGNATVRLWSAVELDAIRNGTADPRLLTLYMNRGTYLQGEPTPCGRTYLAQFLENGMPEHVKFYAVDDDSARWYLAVQYCIPPDSLDEMTTTFRAVQL